MEQPVRWNPAPRPEHPQGDLKGDRRNDTVSSGHARPGSQHTCTQLHAWSCGGWNENGPFLSVVTIVMRHHDQSSLRRKGLIRFVLHTPHHSSSPAEVRAGTQSKAGTWTQELMQRSWRSLEAGADEAMETCSLLARSSLLSSPGFSPWCHALSALQDPFHSEPPTANGAVPSLCTHI